MSIGWYIVPYIRDTDPGCPGPTRMCEIEIYRQQIIDAGGAYSITEVLGNRGVVKIKASDGVLNAIAAVFQRMPKNVLTDSLSDLSIAAKTKIKNELLDMGYSLSEIKTKFGPNVDLGSYTLKDVLKFMAKRRLKPRYIIATDEILVDGIVQGCTPIEFVDSKVQ